MRMVQKGDIVKFRVIMYVEQESQFKVIATFSSCCNRWCSIEDINNGMRRDHVNTDDLQIVYPWWHIRRYFK